MTRKERSRGLRKGGEGESRREARSGSGGEGALVFKKVGGSRRITTSTVSDHGVPTTPL